MVGGGGVMWTLGDCLVLSCMNQFDRKSCIYSDLIVANTFEHRLWETQDVIALDITG